MYQFCRLGLVVKFGQEFQNLVPKLNNIANMASLIQSSRLNNIDVIVENTSCQPSCFFIRTEEQADQFFSFNQELQNFYWKWVSSDFDSEKEGSNGEEENGKMLYYTNSLFVAYHQVHFAKYMKRIWVPEF